MQPNRKHNPSSGLLSSLTSNCHFSFTCPWKVHLGVLNTIETGVHDVESQVSAMELQVIDVRWPFRVGQRKWIAEHLLPFPKSATLLNWTLICTSFCCKCKPTSSLKNWFSLPASKFYLSLICWLSMPRLLIRRRWKAFSTSNMTFVALLSPNSISLKASEGPYHPIISGPSTPSTPHICGLGNSALVDRRDGPTFTSSMGDYGPRRSPWPFHSRQLWDGICHTWTKWSWPVTFAI